MNPMPAAVVSAAAEQLLCRLDWHVVRRLEGRHQGSYRTAFIGAGIDVADIRVYELTDDVRHIDWNVTARLDEPYVRKYSEDRDVTVWLLVDRSSSMMFGPAQRGKDVVLVELAVSVARLLTRRGNRVGAILCDNIVERTMSPQSSRNHVLHLAHVLLDTPVRARSTTDLTPLLQAAMATVKSRSVVVLISDFISQPGWERPLALLAQRHEVIAVRLVDRREYELPNVGVIIVEDAETSEQLSVDTSDPVFRMRYRTAADAREAELIDVTRRAGVDLHDVWTDQDLFDALVRLTTRRSRRH